MGHEVRGKRVSRVFDTDLFDTDLYGTPFGGDYLRFERFEGEDERASFEFAKGKIRLRAHRGVRKIVNPYEE